MCAQMPSKRCDVADSAVTVRMAQEMMLERAEASTVCALVGGSFLVSLERPLILWPEGSKEGLKGSRTFFLWLPVLGCRVVV